MSDIKKMQLGQVVDFCIDYNERIDQGDQSGKNAPKPRRRATQAEIDAFFG